MNAYRICAFTAEMFRCAAAVSYLAAFALPACGEMLGIETFAWGIWSCISGWMFVEPLLLAWWANPLMWFAWSASRRGDGWATACRGFVAATIGLSMFVLSPEMRPGLGPGYVLWVGSMVMLTISGLSYEAACRLRERPGNLEIGHQQSQISNLKFQIGDDRFSISRFPLSQRASRDSSRCQLPGRV